MVVVVAAAAQTMLENAPAIVLQQAEADVGQYDILMTPDEGGLPFINFTLAEEVLTLDPTMNLLSPRINFNSRTYDTGCMNTLQRRGIVLEERNWRYLDPRYPFNLTTCESREFHCVNQLCAGSGRLLTRLRLIDSAKEAAMDLGRTWPFGPMEANEAILNEELATLMGLAPGDQFVIVVDTDRSRVPMLTNVVLDHLRPSNLSEIDRISEITQTYANMIFVLTVKGLVNPAQITEKWGRDTDVDLVMEYAQFLPTMRQAMHPFLDPYASDALEQATLANFASRLVMNLPDRVAQYLDTNFDRVQRRVVQFSSKVLFYLGFPGLDMNLRVLEQLEEVRFFTLYLGLILNVILTVMGILSIMLLYSLLMVSIETRTFEMGVLRMVGMKRSVLIKLLICQALSYALPAWASGLFAGQMVALGLIADLESSSQVPLPKQLTPTSILYATVLGLAIPFLASLFPIRKALGVNLHEALDLRHSKTVAVKYSIERSKSGTVSPTLVAVGLCLFIFGFLIYYMLPLALLSFNLVLFFNIFFGIIIGMLFGMILLTLNFEHILERITVVIFFFWEKSVMRNLVLKNLVSHRVRNRKTTIMYAVALGFILFITVAFQTELTSASYQVRQDSGYDMYLVSDSPFPSAVARDLDLLERNYSTVISGTAWISQNIDYVGLEQVEVANRGLIVDEEVNVYSVSPRFFDNCFQEFLKPRMQRDDTSASMTEQLYTVEGAQGTLLGSRFLEFLGLDDLSDRFLLKLNPDDDLESSRAVFQMNTNAFLDSGCTFTFSRFNGADTQSALVPFTTWHELATTAGTRGYGSSVESLPLRAFMLRFSETATDADRDQIFALLEAEPVGSAWDVRTFQADLDTVNDTMTLVFSAATLIAIVLSAFSLMASSYTNIQEQSKEIGILRALGLTNRRIFLLYVYEAFTLVISASLQGVAIGSMLGFTMLQQRVLFTQLPVTFVFPWTILVTVVVGAIVVALLSSLMPIRLLSKKSIAQVMRTVI